MKTPARIRTSVPLLLPRSHTSTAENRTGSWSFLQPSYLDKTSPCSEACPCGQDIPRIEMLASRGSFAAAWRAILAENPLPSVCGRVCFHPCEKACNRGELDQAVSVNALERFLADAAAEDRSAHGLAPRASTGKSVAVVGSGPAGLAAAYFLSLLGHRCEVYDSMKAAGGLLRYGIPAYRLPDQALDRDIERIEALGAGLRLGVRIDEAFLDSASKKYDAVFLACGNGRGAKLGTPGEELALDALSLLESIRSGTGIPRLAGAEVAVLGGGNTAIDAARSLKRLGAKPLIVYRRRREDMPAFDKEVSEALAEGIGLRELRSPRSLAKKAGRLELELQVMRPAGIGADGRGKVEAVEGRVEILHFDAVYAALGASTAQAWAAPTEPSRALRLGHCAVEWKGRGGIPFAYGGDSVNELESVPDAIASGKELAIALDAFFAGGEAAVAPALERCAIGSRGSRSMELYLGGERRLRSSAVVRFADLNPDYFKTSPRAERPSLPASVAAASFEEAERGLRSEEALAEAARCFNCGLCNGCDNCRTFCPDAAVLTVAGSAAAPEGRRIDKEHCKGCGICVQECPRDAIGMEEARS